MERQRSPHQGPVLRALRDGGPTSRARLSAVTGLSLTTISKTVSPLLDTGMLTEQNADYSGFGRPTLSLIPVPEAVTVCGIQMSAGTVRLGLADAEARVRATRSFAFARDLAPEPLLARIAEEASALIAEDDGARCIGVGVGAPGHVDNARRSVRLAINLGWHDVPVADRLEESLGLPTVVDHNVRSLALGEARYGDHGTESVAYLYVRTGVGLGVTLRGEPFFGGPGPGGESYLSHTRVVANGELCSCGSRGCLETVVSEPYIARRLDPLRGGTPADPEVMRALHALVMSGIPDAVALEDSVVDYLATALSIVVNLFTPELVLIGGMLSSASPVVVARLRERVRESIFPLLRDTLRLEVADGRDEALVRGAAAIALEALHYS